MIFPYKPSNLGDPHDYGTPQKTMVVPHQGFNHLDEIYDLSWRFDWTNNWRYKATKITFPYDPCMVYMLTFGVVVDGKCHHLFRIHGFYRIEVLKNKFTYYMYRDVFPPLGS